MVSGTTKLSAVLGSVAPSDVVGLLFWLDTSSFDQQGSKNFVYYCNVSVRVIPT